MSQKIVSNLVAHYYIRDQHTFSAQHIFEVPMLVQVHAWAMLKLIWTENYVEKIITNISFYVEKLGHTSGC